MLIHLFLCKLMDVVVNIHCAEGAAKHIIVCILVQLLDDLLCLSHLLIIIRVELAELIARVCGGIDLLFAHFDETLLQALYAWQQIALKHIKQF